MTEYVWHVARVGGMWADERATQVVRVLAWFESSAVVVDCVEAGPLWLPREGATPYRVNLSELRLGYPPAEAVAA